MSSSTSSIPRAPTAPGLTYCGKCEKEQQFTRKDDNFIEPELPPVSLMEMAYVKYFTPDRFTLAADGGGGRRFALQLLHDPVDKDAAALPLWQEKNLPNCQYVRDNYAPIDDSTNPVVFVRKTPMVTTSFYCIECYNRVAEKILIAQKEAVKQATLDAKMIAVVDNADFFNRSYRRKPFGSQEKAKRTKRSEDMYNCETCTNCIGYIANDELYVGTASDPDTNLCMKCYEIYHRKKYTKTQ